MLDMTLTAKTWVTLYSIFGEGPRAPVSTLPIARCTRTDWDVCWLDAEGTGDLDDPFISLCYIPEVGLKVDTAERSYGLRSVAPHLQWKTGGSLCLRCIIYGGFDPTLAGVPGD